jgi:hypothetical protein
LNLKTLSKPKTTDINVSATPHLHHNTNALIPSFTLCPGITTRYQFISTMNPLEVAMKKSRWNLKMRQDRQDVLMKPQMHRKHEETCPLGVTYQEGFMSGTGGLDVLSMKNKPDKKKTFRNEEATRTIGKIPQNEEMLRTMMQIIW